MTERKPESETNARGWYKPSTQTHFFVEEPTDIVANGIRVPEHAVEATWGKKGLDIYRAAIAEDEQSPDLP